MSDVYKDNEWSSQDLNALHKFNNFDEDFIISNVFYGEDGRLYLLGNNMLDFRNALYKLSDGGDFEKVDIKRFYDMKNGRTYLI